VVVASPDVCPTSGLLAFVREDGTVARMAAVKRVTTSTPAYGRYLLGPKLAAGGMATVHLGRLLGPAGFSRTVAIKRLHPNLASDPELVRRFVDEARIASRIRHANVVPTLDVVDEPRGVLLVLEYVHGEALGRLLRIAASRGRRCPPQVASAIVIGVLRGLHVAHEAKGASGAPLDLVHRDVSPQNVLVGADGVARVLDFGIAKAADREQDTITRGNPRDVKGKLAYMAPEQVSGEPLDRRCDLFAAGVILWEALSGERLFRGDDAVATMDAIFHRDPPRLAGAIDGVSTAVDDVIAGAVAKDPTARPATADELARALEAVLPPGSDREVAEWVESIAGEVLAARAREVANFERTAEAPDEEPGEDATTDARTVKRGAIVPPPLSPMRDEAKTVPAFDLPAPPEAEPPARAVPTPMSMVAPIDPLAQSGMSSTRIEPLDSRHVARVRTPIPMPVPPPRTGPSRMRLVLLAMTPPAIAAAIVLAIDPFTPADAPARAPVAAAAPPPAPADPPPVIAPIAPVAPVATVIATSSPPPARASHGRTTRPSRAARPHKR
jgi:serine/threonine-protein kinase